MDPVGEPEDSGPVVHLPVNFIGEIVINQSKLHGIASSVGSGVSILEDAQAVIFHNQVIQVLTWGSVNLEGV